MRARNDGKTTASSTSHTIQVFLRHPRKLIPAWITTWWPWDLLSLAAVETGGASECCNQLRSRWVSARSVQEMLFHCAQWGMCSLCTDCNTCKRIAWNGRKRVELLYYTMPFQRLPSWRKANAALRSLLSIHNALNRGEIWVRFSERTVCPEHLLSLCLPYMARTLERVHIRKAPSSLEKKGHSSSQTAQAHTSTDGLEKKLHKYLLKVSDGNRARSDVVSSHDPKKYPPPMRVTQSFCFQYSQIIKRSSEARKNIEPKTSLHIEPSFRFICARCIVVSFFAGLRRVCSQKMHSYSANICI